MVYRRRHSMSHSLHLSHPSLARAFATIVSPGWRPTAGLGRSAELGAAGALAPQRCALGGATDWRPDGLVFFLGGGGGAKTGRPF